LEKQTSSYFCSYCGKRYTEKTAFKELHDHIYECPQHPLPIALKKIRKLNEIYMKISGLIHQASIIAIQDYQLDEKES